MKQRNTYDIKSCPMLFLLASSCPFSNYKKRGPFIFRNTNLKQNENSFHYTAATYLNHKWVTYLTSML
jgi:sulfatase maturation enzyme AslB (radical SAM superfamily)